MFQIIFLLSLRIHDEEAFQTAADESKQIDLMVNNAGTLNEYDWEPVVQLNLVACVRGSKLAMKHMSKKNGGRGGRIINTCSDLGLIDFHQLPLYCATKHGVRSFTSSMALHPDKELTGVQFACICPSVTRTDLMRSYNETISMAEDLEAIAIPTSRVAEGFLKLLRMSRMNGAILYIDKLKCEFCKLEYVGLGPVWTPQQ
ncbi:15-hydroxyprostaglandin dehydrogenase [NAD(+)] [Plakobranchus ocellatus]|uniref:15-hydroxyprostaglandin dehydrogenase [NAD(+)] n=1 Tax=Plakobranchus ocellatus TaxID=259542 RepID=A0AAV4AZA4_9GAST|nr:15-hydroxyprostaglandin dehydrogenase [NAD(+)] [Plakobranchus ocellatus]